jgi:hypothetical protein
MLWSEAHFAGVAIYLLAREPKGSLFRHIHTVLPASWYAKRSSDAFGRSAEGIYRLWVLTGGGSRR